MESQGMNKVAGTNSLSFLSQFDQVIGKFPDSPAMAGDLAGSITGATPVITYRELDQRARVIASSLNLLGCKPGTVIAIHADARAMAIAAMIAVLRSGC